MPHRVLLVDDDIAEISAVKRVLLRAGAQAQLATNATDALAALAAGRPALALIAPDCENGEGLRLARKLASDAATRGLPVLLLGLPEEDVPGAVVPRPIDPAQLAAELARLLGPAEKPAAGPSPSATPAPPSSRAAVAGPSPTARTASPAPAPAARAIPTATPTATATPTPTPTPTAAAAPTRAPTPASAPDAAEAEERRQAAVALRARAEELRRAGAEERARRERQALQRRDAEIALEERGRIAEEADSRRRAEEEARRAIAASEAEEALRQLAEEVGVSAPIATPPPARAAPPRPPEPAPLPAVRPSAPGRPRQGEAVAPGPPLGTNGHSPTPTVNPTPNAAPAPNPADPLVLSEGPAEQARSRRATPAAAPIPTPAATSVPTSTSTPPPTRTLSATPAATSTSTSTPTPAAATTPTRTPSATSAATPIPASSLPARPSTSDRSLADDLFDSSPALGTNGPIPSTPPPAPPPRASPAATPAPARASAAARYTPAPVRSAAALAAAAAEAAREEARRRASAARARKAAELPVPEPLAPPRSASPAPATLAVPFSPPDPAPPPQPEVAPVPPDLAAGSLDKVSAARLLSRAARARLTGRIDFAGSAPRSLYFEEGRLVGATSGAPAERVEEIALRLGLITREQHRQASAACAGLPSRRAAMALLDLGFLKPEELTGLVRRRTEEVVFALFSEPGATWRHTQARAPAEERTALDRTPHALAVEGVRRRWGAEVIDLLLGGPATLLEPARGGPPREELGLGREERRLLELADGLRTLDEIAGDGPLDPLSSRQVLAALVEVGTLAVRIRSQPETAAASSAIDLARLAEKLDQVRRADYFTILGVSRAATPYELRASADRLLQELDAPRWALLDEPGLEERLAEVRRVVAEAREVLLDPELRASYLQGLD